MGRPRQVLEVDRHDLTLAHRIEGVRQKQCRAAKHFKLRRTKDRVWLSLGGIVSGAVLTVAIVAPGYLNSWWELDVAVAVSDANKLVLVPRAQPKDPGTPLKDDDWIDAAKDRFTKELTTAQKLRFLARIGSRAVDPAPKND